MSDNRTGCMYRMTFPNGKAYIGITCKTLEKRIAGHVNRTVSNIRRNAVNHAIAKYGIENVAIEKLLIANYDYLKLAEIAAIRAFGTVCPNGYNVTAGGEGALGIKVSDSTREKMRLSHIGQKLSPENKAMLISKNTGRPVSEETRAKIRASKIGIKHPPRSDSCRAKQRAAKLGVAKSKESIIKREAVKAENRLIDKYYGLRDSARIKCLNQSESE